MAVLRGTKLLACLGQPRASVRPYYRKHGLYFYCTTPFWFQELIYG